MSRRYLPSVLGMAALLGGLLALLPWSTPFFHALFPDLDRPVYTRASFVDLTVAHIELVLIATTAAALIGVTGGILVTREGGKRLMPLLSASAAIGQTFPPVAVLALTVPILGYGSGATIVALFVYALLPIIANTIAGLEGVDPDVRDAADGMGFRPLRRLIQVELPLAAPVIMAGIRTSAIINVGTATLGSTVGALSLGAPIIEGLSGSNTAFVVQGAILVATLSMLVDRSLNLGTGKDRTS